MSRMFKSKEVTIKDIDCDPDGIIKPSSIWDYFQKMASLHAVDLGVGFEEMVSKNMIWVILYQQYVIVDRLPRLNETVILNTWPKESTKIELEREYEFRDLNGNLLVKGISNWTVIDSNTRKLVRADKIVFNGEYYTKCNFNEKQKRKIGLSFDNFLSEYEYIIVDKDIDSNKHLNNAKYLDIISNMGVIDNKKVKRQEISFIHEAYLGNTIKIGYNIDQEGNACFIGTYNGNPCFEARYELED